eukprot:TRINITY_DN16697_c0_g1_i1.p1 TRINITY_DN16697_c0_g1~~TRINITY_DN16697_c0_g1_i1.p1  ORF type:complete len:587 (+),score=88.85 TRINITY_DN16697_c0_g1_i1:43-1803(+)
MYPRKGKSGSGAREGNAYRARLVRFYEHYDASKLVIIDDMLEDAEGGEEMMFAALVKIHGPEPVPYMDVNSHKPDLDYRRRLTNMYTCFAPDKLSDVDELLEAHAGREETLLSALVAKYGPEPADQLALPASLPIPKKTRNRNAKLPAIECMAKAASERLRRSYYFRWLEALWWKKNRGALQKVVVSNNADIQREKMNNQKLRGELTRLKARLAASPQPPMQSAPTARTQQPMQASQQRYLHPEQLPRQPSLQPVVEPHYELQPQQPHLHSLPEYNWVEIPNYQESQTQTQQEQRRYQNAQQQTQNSPTHPLIRRRQSISPEPQPQSPSGLQSPRQRQYQPMQQPQQQQQQFQDSPQQRAPQVNQPRRHEQQQQQKYQQYQPRPLQPQHEADGNLQPKHTLPPSPKHLHYHHPISLPLPHQQRTPSQSPPNNRQLVRSLLEANTRLKQELDEEKDKERRARRKEHKKGKRKEIHVHHHYYEGEESRWREAMRTNVGGEKKERKVHPKSLDEMLNVLGTRGEARVKRTRGGVPMVSPCRSPSPPVDTLPVHKAQAKPLVNHTPFDVQSSSGTIYPHGVVQVRAWPVP